MINNQYYLILCFELKICYPKKQDNATAFVKSLALICLSKIKLPFKDEPTQMTYMSFQ